MRQGEIVAGRFEVLRLAGSGGMARVFRARDRETGRDVALKLMHGASDDDARRFAREARTLSDLAHPGIVRYVAHGATPELGCFLAMEWLDGEDLGRRLGRGGMTVSDTIAVGHGAGEALGAAHRRGIVHRDVKPTNLFLTGGADPPAGPPRVKLLDFGIAHMELVTRRLTRTGMTMGTPGYMSPEQARGEREVEPRADVFALGCVLFECLTGRPAFVADHPMALLGRIVFEESPRVSSLVMGVPRELDELLARMLAKSAADRPDDGDAVARALAAVPHVAGAAASAGVARPPALTRAEQRIVSVVVAATTTSSAPTVPATPHHGRSGAGAGGDRAEATPEDGGPREGGVGAVEALRAAAARHGARVEVLADGSVVALLPGGALPTEQAARAARCALAMRAALPGCPMVLATGRGVVEGDLPVGDVIHRAARALEGAPTEGVRVDDATIDLLDARFDVAHGDASSPPATLRGERGPERGRRTLLGKAMPCVGRDREVGLLVSTFEECVGEHAATAVLVTGAPGIGKSRLLHELLRHVQARGDDVELVVAHGDPLAAGSAFGLLGPALRRRAGILDGEPAADQRVKVQALVSRRLGAARDRVIHFLGELMGVPFGDDASPELRAARRDGPLMGDQVRAAWETWLASVCKARPLLFVIEDLQWGDLPTVQAVDGALRSLSDAPFMTLALARPEVHERFPRLWPERKLLEIGLAGLGRRASERLVREALDGSATAAVLADVCDRAGGNPLYLEELVRAVAHGKHGELPETVLGMIQARLLELDPEARLVLRAASVFGTVFWAAGAAHLLGAAAGAAAAEWLSELERQELVSPRGESRLSGEAEYAFQNATLRDAAYAMLTEDDRVLGHHLAGEWLESHGEQGALVLAEHFERGGDPARAVAYYASAAEQAMAAFDYEGAEVRAERGVSCGAEGEALGRLRLAQAEAAGWRADFERALGFAEAAIAALPRGEEAWFRAVGEAIHVSAPLGRSDAVLAWTAELTAETGAPGAAAARARVVALGRAVIQLALLGRHAAAGDGLRLAAGLATSGALRGDALVTARLHQARGFTALAAGDLDAALREQLEGARAFERAGAERQAQSAFTFASFVQLELGRFAEAEALLGQTLATADRMGLTLSAGLARVNLTYARLSRGVVDEAASGGVAAFVAAGVQDRRVDAITRGYLAEILAMGGDLAGAEREARQAVERLRSFPPFRARALGILTKVLLERGRAAEAVAAAREGLALFESVGTTLVGESQLHLSYARALHAAGETTGAREAILAARDRMLERAGRIADPELRESFLGAVRENVSTAALAREWAG